MPGDISADTSRIKGYAAGMRKCPVLIKTELIGAVNRVSTEGEAQAKRFVPTDTHNLQRSITMVAAREMGGAIRGAWGTNVPYARTMEEGRSPGSAMPPSGVLLGWMARHGIDERMEFVVRRAIGRHGIVGKRYMQRAHDAVKPHLKVECQRAMKRALGQAFPK